MKKRNFISYEDSIEKLDSLKMGVKGFEKTSLQNSLGRILADDIVASENSPQFPTASLDGFAIKALDQKLDFLEIENIDNPAGGELGKFELKNGFAIKTFTGSVMPKGSDTLIQIENVTPKDGKLFFDIKVSIGNGVRPVGEIYKTGDIILKKGIKIGYAEIGVLASLNYPAVKVVQKPKVAILSTGSEILEVGETQKTSSQIRSSNNYTLEALTLENGAIPIQMGIVKDDKTSLTEAIQNAIYSKAEIIVTTGGVSVGDYDFVDEVVKKVGFETVLHGVKIKPGQHILIAKNSENQVLIALPGFAYSSTVTFILYVLPLIRNMLGLKFEPTVFQAKLREKFYKKSRKTEFTACNINFENGEILANFENKKVGTSAILTNMLDSSYLLFSSENSGDKEISDIVDILQII